LIIFFCFFLSVSAVQAESGLVRIAENVYSYVDVKEASAANSFGANAGIIIGDSGIAVIDTLVSAREAKRFIKDIRAITEKPVKYVINTHYHLDHTFGNAEFAQLGAAIIAHAYCGDAMRKNTEEVLKNAGNFGLTPEDMEGTEIAYPDITFTDRMRLDLGNVSVELIHIAPSHSNGSIIVYLPAEKLAFSGDIIFTDFHPFMLDGDIQGWVRTLDYLMSLDADRIIPGHGQVSGKKDILDFKNYIIAFDEKARELAAGNNDVETMLTTLRKSIPARSRGEGFIEANFLGRYLKRVDVKN